jgi:hypothetical protein
MSEAWSRVSLRVSSSEWSVAQVRSFLGIEGSRRSNERVWLVEFLPGEAERPLDEKLLQAQRFIESHATRLRTLPSHCSKDLFIGWTPAGPQAGLVFPASLIDALSLIGADVIVDAYSD